MKKGIVVGVGIAIIGILFVIQDFGSQTTIDPVQSEPISQPVPDPVSQNFESTKSDTQPTLTYSDIPESVCSGFARCFSGIVTSIIDGDTIRVNDHSIRFAMASSPELDEPKGMTARVFIDTLCPVGSEALVDEDDGQTQGSYGRILGVVYCNDVNLNEELLDSGVGYLLDEFCDESEFASTDWAQKHGCNEDEPQPQVAPVESDCDNSYPDFCIPPPPPDFDCKDIPQKRFTVLQPDPHRFDGDKDGIGCEL